MYCQNCGKQIPDGSTSCAECGASQVATAQPMQFSAPPIASKPKKKKTALWIVLGIVVLIIIIAIATGGDDEGTTKDKVTPSVSDTADVKETDDSNTADLTTGQKNALQKAKDYLSITAFSHDGLVQQLEIGEKFAHEDAVYGADNCGADWNEQAAAKAKDYLDMMAFSRDGLIEQLEVGEKFTHEQAVYGAEANGY
ncbi:MAG: Ltp family lipoprotein [Oscillospiraceae bacterium]|nr:Ltp family lipoprotein [Oscillospiraceae bacterium]